MVKPGDRILLGNDAYGGTFRLISKVYGPAGCSWSAVDLSDPAALDAAWPDDGVLVWLETPTNPLLTCIDIEAVADVAHRHGGRCVVDNTFATPYLQRPLELRADAVVHSATKYLGGHSDVIGGFVALDDDEIAEPLRFIQNAAGAVPGPFDCYLVLRGLKTLAVRMDRHCANARAIVDLLVGHPAVDRVLYPQLPDHPGHAAAAKQMRDFGGMVSFTCVGGEAAALEIVRHTELFTLAESLGAVESLIEHPGRMTHASAVGLAVAGRRVARSALGGHRVVARPRRRPRGRRSSQPDQSQRGAAVSRCLRRSLSSAWAVKKNVSRRSQAMRFERSAGLRSSTTREQYHGSISSTTGTNTGEARSRSRPSARRSRLPPPSPTARFAASTAPRHVPLPTCATAGE